MIMAYIEINRVIVCDKVDGKLYIWITYLGSNLHIEVQSDQVSGTIYVTTDANGTISVGGNKPVICKNYGHKFWTGFNGFCIRAGTAKTVPTDYWEDSLVEYKL
jgi:hypothetical protein